MNKTIKKPNHLWKLLAGIFLILVVILVIRLVWFPKPANATVNYPSPTAECTVTTPQGFKIGVLAYRWVLTSETSTTATFKLQLDINPTNNETWHDVGTTRTVDKVCPTPEPTISPTPTVDPCLQILSKDAVVDPCVTPTVIPEPTVEPTKTPDLGDDPNSCTHRDCNTHPESEKVVNNSGQPLLPPSKSSK